MKHECLCHKGCKYLFLSHLDIQIVSDPLLCNYDTLLLDYRPPSISFLSIFVDFQTLFHHYRHHSLVLILFIFNLLYHYFFIFLNLIRFHKIINHPYSLVAFIKKEFYFNLYQSFLNPR